MAGCKDASEAAAGSLNRFVVKAIEGGKGHGSSWKYVPHLWRRAHRPEGGTATLSWARVVPSIRDGYHVLDVLRCFV
jgi:hypothetical protein